MLNLIAQLQKSILPLQSMGEPVLQVITDLSTESLSDVCEDEIANTFARNIWQVQKKFVEKKNTPMQWNHKTGSYFKTKTVRNDSGS